MQRYAPPQGKPVISREERLRRAQEKEMEGRVAMQEYIEEQKAIAAKTERLRALRLARDAEQASEAAAPAKPAARKKPAARRGIGSS